MRLIDADALKDYKCSACENRERCEDRETVCSDIAEIDEQPTVNAEPVKHGRWFTTRDENKKLCSECGVIHLIAQYPCGRARYCPNCGARMDGD